MSIRDFVFWFAGYVGSKTSLDHEELYQVKEQLHRVMKEINK